MKLRIYQVDAFTDRIFSGNPAAVCPLEEWLSETIMQQIAMENNLAETAFFVKRDQGYEIRWFTPTLEVDLCGHATLASAFVLFNCAGHTADTIRFYSPRSGHLEVKRHQNYLTLNFPADFFTPVPITAELEAAFDIAPKAAYKGRTDYMLVFGSEEHVRRAKPDLARIAQLNARGVIITAKGNEVDFVSRFFAPQSGIDEDPVTGSAHTTLTPYWASELRKNELTARQLSARQGYLRCNHLDDRVEISGQARLYLTGEIELD